MAALVAGGGTASRPDGGRRHAGERNSHSNAHRRAASRPLLKASRPALQTLFTIAKEIVKATDAAGGEEPRTVWWHQIDDGDDDTYAVRDFSAWAATRDLRKARLHLMNNRGADGVAALEKLRQDLLLYARDAG